MSEFKRVSKLLIEAATTASALEAHWESMISPWANITAWLIERFRVNLLGASVILWVYAKQWIYSECLLSRFIRHEDSTRREHDIQTWLPFEERRKISKRQKAKIPRGAHNCNFSSLDYTDPEWTLTSPSASITVHRPLLHFFSRTSQQRLLTS